MEGVESANALASEVVEAITAKAKELAKVRRGQFSLLVAAPVALEILPPPSP